MLQQHSIFLIFQNQNVSGNANQLINKKMLMTEAVKNGLPIPSNHFPSLPSHSFLLRCSLWNVGGQ